MEHLARVQRIIWHDVEFLKDFQTFRQDFKQNDHKTGKIMTDHGNSNMMKNMAFQNPGF